MNSKILAIFIGFTFLAATKLQALSDPREGKNIFTARCMACHKIDKDFAGPALANVDKRHTEEWIMKFVHSPQAVIKSGDPSAMALFAKFNNIVMPDHPDLSNENISSILAYIKEESVKISSAVKPPLERPYELQPNYSPFIYTNPGFIISYIIGVITLVFALLFAVHVKQFEIKMRQNK